MNMKDSELREPVDIGLPYTAPAITAEQKRWRLANRLHLEQAARHRTLVIEPKEVESESESSTWPLQLARLGSHFGIFQDLFHPDAYFHPQTSLDIAYDLGEGETLAPVFFGNQIPPSATCDAPSVSYKGEETALYTLLMTNPDGNPFEEGKEMLHWLVSNITGDRVGEGDVLCEYVQALPFKGTGWHRIVFLLFRQDNGRIELDRFSKESPRRSMQERSFSTPDFYKRMEDDITPVGMGFFQSQWDVSCRHSIHNTMESEMPIFEYDWPDPEIREQEEHPSRPMPFNMYLDKYRDQKNIEEELLKKRLRRTSPFVKENRKREKYPDIFWYENKHSMTSWEHMEKQKENVGAGKYKAIYENRIK